MKLYNKKYRLKNLSINNQYINIKQIDRKTKFNNSHSIPAKLWSTRLYFLINILHQNRKLYLILIPILNHIIKFVLFYIL